MGNTVNQTRNQKPKSVSRRWLLRSAALAFVSGLFKKSEAMSSGNGLTTAPAAAANSAASVAARAARHAKKIASPQWRDGKFRNGLPETTQFSKALVKMFTSRQTTPATPIPVVNRKRSDFDSPPTSGLRVTWISHSSLLIELEGARFLTDPVWAERASPVSFAGPKRFFPAPLPLTELPELDAVVLSHDHYDHYCRETLEFLGRTKTRFVVPLGVADRLEDLGIHHSRITEYDWWEEVQIGPVKLACVPARHFSGRSLFDRNSTLWCGWAFIGQKRRFYFSGDTAYFPEFKTIGEKYGPFDIAAIESAAYNSAWPDVHIGPEQALQACKDLRGKIYLPIHWATFNLSTHSWTEPGERLLVGAQAAQVRLVLPRPGESVDPDAISESLLKKWWPDTEWETAEQSPVISTGT